MYKLVFFTSYSHSNVFLFKKIIFDNNFFSEKQALQNLAGSVEPWFWMEKPKSKLYPDKSTVVAAS